MDQEIIEGYHATNKSNEESIIKFGYDLNKCKDEEQWLGKGVYFWKSLYYAVEWNYIHIHSFSKKAIWNNIIRNKTIFKAEIFIEKSKMLDLTSPEGTILFEEFQTIVKSNLNKEDLEEAQKKDDVFWIYMIQKRGFFENFDILVASYRKEIKKNEIRSNKNFEKYIQTQICVKRVKNIIHNQVYNDTSRIKHFFEHIYINRTNSERIIRRIWDE